MASPFLLIGKETRIGAKLAERLGLEGRSIVALGQEESSKYMSFVPWNRASYISAKTAIRETSRLHGFPETVFIVFGRQRDENFPDIGAASIDETIDSDLKALIYMVQELVKKASEAGADCAFFFLCEKSEDARHPVSAAAAAGFKRFCSSIMGQGSGSFYMAGFELADGDEEGFIEAALKAAAERPSKRRGGWTLWPKANFFNFGQTKR